MKEMLMDDVLTSVSGGVSRDFGTPFEPGDKFESCDGETRFEVTRVGEHDPCSGYIYYGNQKARFYESWVDIHGESFFYDITLRNWNKTSW